MEWSNISDLMRKDKAIGFKVYDGKKKLWEHIDSDTDGAINELEEVQPMFEDYRKLYISTTKDSGTNAWRHCNEFTVTNPNSASNSNSQMGGFGRGSMNNPFYMLQMLQNMQGNNSNELMQAKLDLMQQQFDFAREKDRLAGDYAAKNNSIIPEKYDKWIDYGIMKVIGMEPDTLFKMHQMYGDGQSALAGPPPQTVPVTGTPQPPGSSVETNGYEVSFSQDQVNELSALIVDIDKKGVQFPKIKGILTAMRDKPALIDMALQFLNTK